MSMVEKFLEYFIPCMVKQHAERVLDGSDLERIVEVEDITKRALSTFDMPLVIEDWEMCLNKKAFAALSPEELEKPYTALNKLLDIQDIEFDCMSSVDDAKDEIISELKALWKNRKPS